MNWRFDIEHVTVINAGTIIGLWLYNRFIAEPQSAEAEKA